MTPATADRDFHIGVDLDTSGGPEPGWRIVRRTMAAWRFRHRTLTPGATILLRRHQNAFDKARILSNPWRPALSYLPLTRAEALPPRLLLTVMFNGLLIPMNFAL